ncbi:MFS transporter [Aestuariimicrobium ganziense]|uniref:MFS transporter n=1 Tax=Aestuariimicrobium ganziense TaxID=2773677 RepID=UPI001940999F|nr:MFS transporter [Aestuariimicrobium ganziense]
MTERLWTPTFIGVTLASLGNSMIFYLLVPTMAAYATTRFGANDVEAGALSSVFFIGALLARLVSGWAVDRFGSRTLAIASAVFYLLTTIGYLVTPTLWTTMGLRLFNGIGFGLLGSALTSGVMLIVPAHRRSEGAGWVGVGNAAAVGLGPWLALTLAATRWQMRGVFPVAIAFAALSLVLLLTLGRDLPGRQQVHQAAVTRPGLGSLLDARALSVGAMVVLGGFAYAAVLTYLGPASAGTGLVGAASLFFLVYAGVVLFSRPVGGRLQDRFGERTVLAPALGGLGIGLGLVTAAIALAGRPVGGVLLLVAAVILGAGWGTVTTGGQAAAVNRVPRERTGAAVATFFFCLDLGTGVGPILLGVLVAPFGYVGLYLAATVVAVASLVLYLGWTQRSIPAPAA